MDRENRVVPAQLPADIWQQVANWLDTKDWVQLSSTCKAMHAVQPARIELTGATASALTWVQRRWGAAKGINLEFTSMELPWVIDHQAPGLSSLLELRMVVQGGFTLPSGMFLAWLLAQASALQLLVISAAGTVMVPPMKNLRHLVLSGTSFDERTFACLNQLKKLRTLHLQGDDTDSAQLDLTGLPDLVSVHIEEVSLAGLELPSHCRLHATVELTEGMRQWWSHLARGHQIGQFTISDAHQEWEEDVVPEILRSARCARLHWGISRIGTPSQPASLSGVPFTGLQELYMIGDDINMVLPGSLVLKVLHVTARNAQLDFEDPGALARSLEEISIVFTILRGTGMVQLAVAISQVGKSLIPLNEEAVGEEFAGFYLKRYCRGMMTWSCECGACLSCLMEIGIGLHLNKAE